MFVEGEEKAQHFGVLDVLDVVAHEADYAAEEGLERGADGG